MAPIVGFNLKPVPGRSRAMAGVLPHRQRPTRHGGAPVTWGWGANNHKGLEGFLKAFIRFTLWCHQTRLENPRTEWRFYEENRLFLWSIFQLAVFDYRRVSVNKIVGCLERISLINDDWMIDDDSHRKEWYFPCFCGDDHHPIWESRSWWQRSLNTALFAPRRSSCTWRLEKNQKDCDLVRNLKQAVASTFYFVLVPEADSWWCWRRCRCWEQDTRRSSNMAMENPL